MAKLTFTTAHPNPPMTREGKKKAGLPLREPVRDTRHERMIRGFCAEFPNAQRLGFGTTLRTILKAADDDCYDGPTRFGVTPDAYVIHAEDEVVVAYEAEDGCKVSAYKMECYRELAWALNHFYWNLVLVREDRYGGRRSIDVFEEILTELCQQASRKG